MSLIGSLDDLGLGDILQIINLSQKSGVLIVIGDQGEGRIVFRDGLVRGAARKGGPQTLRDLLVGGGVLSEEVYQSAVESGGELDVAGVLFERELITLDQLVELSREAVENTVVEMFSWQTGEFSFDVRSEGEPGDPKLLLATGINAQFLAMEGARRQDENGQSSTGELEFGICESEPTPDQDASDGREQAVEPVSDGSKQAVHIVAERAASAVAKENTFAELRDLVDDAGAPSASAEDASEDTRNQPAVFIEGPLEETPGVDAAEFDAPVVDAADVEASFIDAEPLVEPSCEVDGEDEGIPVAPGVRDSDLSEPAAVSHTRSEAEVGSHPEPVAAIETPAAAAGPQDPAASPAQPAVVVIDPELRVLEWTKGVLKGDFDRVHIFQQSSMGLVRIRQYLARAEIPLVLISPDAGGEPSAGIRDSADFVRRLKEQAPRMRILWLCETSSESPNGRLSGSIKRPRLALLRDARAAYERDEIAEALRRDLFEALAAVPPSSGGNRQRAEASEVTLQRLREATEDLSAASVRGEVLPRVIEFARESFARVAMFLVRDGRAEGMAESGLSSGGGPDSSAFCELSLAISECGWFQRVLEQRTSLAAAPGPADGELCDRLGGVGSPRPVEAYVAPIESSGQIVALLYADHLPDQRAIGDTSALEVVLSHAGLALDRALLERALHEVDGEDAAGSQDESSG